MFQSNLSPEGSFVTNKPNCIDFRRWSFLSYVYAARLRREVRSLKRRLTSAKVLLLHLSVGPLSFHTQVDLAGKRRDKGSLTEARGDKSCQGRQGCRGREEERQKDESAHQACVGFPLNWTVLSCVLLTVACREVIQPAYAFTAFSPPSDIHRRLCLHMSTCRWSDASHTQIQAPFND